MRDLILQLSKSSIYSTKPLALANLPTCYLWYHGENTLTEDITIVTCEQGIPVNRDGLFFPFFGSVSFSFSGSCVDNPRSEKTIIPQQVRLFASKKYCPASLHHSRYIRYHTGQYIKKTPGGICGLFAARARSLRMLRA
ncbi:hypothetical protein QIG09_17305, partial [Klebsiella pneumoniae]|nr:hypothetical protein [Klebsiella pneumoniae]